MLLAVDHVANPVPVQRNLVAHADLCSQTNSVDAGPGGFVDDRSDHNPVAVPDQWRAFHPCMIVFQAHYPTRSDPASIEDSHGLCGTPGIAEHRDPGVDAKHDEAMVWQRAGGQRLGQIGEKRPAATSERGRDRRANAFGAHLVKCGTTQPVRLDDPHVEDVRWVGTIKGVGDQLQMWQRAIEVLSPGAQPMIITSHSTAEEPRCVVGSAVAMVIGWECIARKQHRTADPFSHRAPGPSARDPGGPAQPQRHQVADVLNEEP